MASKKTDEYRMSMIQTIQNNLTYLMNSKGWTNKDLSEETGIALSDLSKYRNISYNTLPRVTELAKICEIFHVSFDYMIGLDPGGRYTDLTENQKHFLDLYNLASENDKLVIETLLSKYNYLTPENPSEE